MEPILNLERSEQRILPLKNLRPILARNSKTRNTVGERHNQHELIEIQRFDSLEKIEEETDNNSAKINTCLLNFEAERERPPRLIERFSERQKDSRNAVTGKMAWLNVMMPKRDRRGEYM